MPVVRLRDRTTNQDSIFINVHNPANTSRFPHQDEQTGPVAEPKRTRGGAVTWRVATARTKPSPGPGTTKRELALVSSPAPPRMVPPAPTRLMIRSWPRDSWVGSGHDKVTIVRVEPFVRRRGVRRHRVRARPLEARRHFRAGTRRPGGSRCRAPHLTGAEGGRCSALGLRTAEVPLQVLLHALSQLRVVEQPVELARVDDEEMHRRLGDHGGGPRNVL